MEILKESTYKNEFEALVNELKSDTNYDEIAYHIHEYSRMDKKKASELMELLFDLEDSKSPKECRDEIIKHLTKSKSNISESWQDDWVEPYVEKEPIEEINGLYIYKGTDQYGDEAYYLFLEDEDPDPGYEEWQTETLELAREWASSYEPFIDEDDIDDMLLEGNNVSEDIPYMIHEFLRDVAQIAGTITYSDIMNFKYTEKDKVPLNKLKRVWYDMIDEDADDEVIQSIGHKIADYIKNSTTNNTRL